MKELFDLFSKIPSSYGEWYNHRMSFEKLESQDWVYNCRKELESFLRAITMLMDIHGVSIIYRPERSYGSEIYSEKYLYFDLEVGFCIYFRVSDVGSVDVLIETRGRIVPEYDKGKFVDHLISVLSLECSIRYWRYEE